MPVVRPDEYLSNYIDIMRVWDTFGEYVQGKNGLNGCEEGRDIKSVEEYLGSDVSITSRI